MDKKEIINFIFEYVYDLLLKKNLVKIYIKYSDDSEEYLGYKEFDNKELAMKYIQENTLSFF